MANTLELGGIRLEETARLGKHEVLLNGGGLRTILLVKAYVIALYLQEKKRDCETILAAPGAKRLRIVPLRGLSADQLNDVIDKGIRKNLIGDEFERIESSLDTLRDVINEVGEADAGTPIDLDWVPGTKGGVLRLHVDGVRKGGDIRNQDLYNALLKVWLGDKVNDTKLRDSLLGKR